jgi:hypothetical protein
MTEAVIFFRLTDDLERIPGSLIEVDIVVALHGSTGLGGGRGNCIDKLGPIGSSSLMKSSAEASLDMMAGADVPTAIRLSED